MYRRVIKRIVDILLSFVGILILTPIWVLIVIAIKLDSPGPALFKQKRIGARGRDFIIFKFRTMRTNAPKDTPTHLLEAPEQWITGVGRFLRRTSLDELPQILNVLRGEMSIVGPRPALWNQYDLIIKREKYGANDIRPGLTGWAQINGRDMLDISAKACFDGEYVDRMGFVFDCLCILGTIKAVLRKENIVEGREGKPRDEKAEERE